MKTLKRISLILAIILALGCITASAEEYKVPEPLLYGDVDMDGEVTIKDATAIQKGIAELEYLTSVQRFLADPDKTGVSIKNATNIQKHIAKFEDSSSIGTAIDMQYSDKFSGNIQPSDMYIDSIIVVVKNPELKYTLADFPEYDFCGIEINNLNNSSQDIKEYVLFLSNPGRENVYAAIKTLDYRANLDLLDVRMVKLDLC